MRVLLGLAILFGALIGVPIDPEKIREGPTDDSEASGRHRRRCIPSMTGPTRHVRLAVLETRVKLTHHVDHHAGGHLLRFFVGRPVLDVTKVARTFIQKT